MSAQVEELLRAAGLKVTDQRRKILALLLDNHGPFTAEEMAQKLKAEKFDLATLYRNMTVFEEAGLVQKVVFGDEAQRWELAQSGHGHHHAHHHHHLICTSCKRITTLELCLPDATLRSVANLGYTALKHHLEFSGVCPDCQKRS